MNTEMKMYTVTIGMNKPAGGTVDGDEILKMAQTHFMGATVLEATGIWQGAFEESRQVQFLAPAGSLTAWNFAKEAAKTFGQECVLLTSHAVEFEFVTP